MGKGRLVGIMFLPRMWYFPEKQGKGQQCGINLNLINFQFPLWHYLYHKSAFWIRIWYIHVDVSWEYTGQVRIGGPGYGRIIFCRNISLNGLTCKKIPIIFQFLLIITVIHGLPSISPVVNSFTPFKGVFIARLLINRRQYRWGWTANTCFLNWTLTLSIDIPCGKTFLYVPTFFYLVTLTSNFDILLTKLNLGIN